MYLREPKVVTECCALAEPSDLFGYILKVFLAYLAAVTVRRQIRYRLLLFSSLTNLFILSTILCSPKSIYLIE